MRRAAKSSSGWGKAASMTDSKNGGGVSNQRSLRKELAL
jgi:hypothetical protein